MNRFKGIYYEQPLRIKVNPGEDRIVAVQRQITELCYEIYGHDARNLDYLLIRFLLDDYVVDTLARIDGWGNLEISEFSDYGDNVSIRAIIPISSIFDSFDSIIECFYRHNQNNRVDDKE